MYNIDPRHLAKFSGDYSGAHPYIGWDKDGHVYHIRRHGKRGWHAYTVDQVYHLYAGTLRELSKMLASHGISHRKEA